MEPNQMPLGLAMALAQNPKAMEKFESLSEVKKQEIIDGTHFVNSREEMHQYVSSLVSGQR